ncbi:precorrin-3B C(17)-methyltransferase [Phormidium sp. FACHB-1136]|uniref:precorrin-3B C(17)-methyltransferase n=1 Tax=Phormidium sp. FACHB-1136 TaxID=2692848 RepID=UPI00321FDF10
MSSIAAIATTPAGVKTLMPICAALPAKLWISTSLAETLAADLDPVQHQLQTYEGPLRDVVEHLWPNQSGLIFALATGAVVRLIAPLLQDKATDPAVVVVEETGRQVISLCGGHQGGADGLTRQISQLLDAEAVITGASQAKHFQGIDQLGIPFGWAKGCGDWTAVSAAFAQGQSIEICQDSGTTLWRDHLPADHPFIFTHPADPLSPSPLPASSLPPARLWISPNQPSLEASDNGPMAQWHPRVLWVGVGCERGTPRRVIATAIEQVFQAHGLVLEAIAGVASLDLKADEVGLVELCESRRWPLRCFSADDLKDIPVPNPSAVVDAAVQTPSVAEAAAIVAADRGQLRVPKQVMRLEGEPGAVTVAVAQAEREYTGRDGQLFLVGSGPGRLDQITPAAKQAIVRADAIIGYGLYIDQIRPLCRPGQIVEPWPITQERQRAERAIDLARWGLSVAVVSSGDCGIYGMAGLVFEQLRATGWDGQSPAVEVFPGISALQAAAAQVGAPLMHDFCAISLSDLLTPWEMIVKRLEAAAQADFVIALYNPKSKTRTHQIGTAQQILMAHRSPQTPVAVVKSVYRPDQEIHLTTLGDLLSAPIDMLTVVLIGNQSTRQHQDWLITPRGYLGFDVSSLNL